VQDLHADAPAFGVHGVRDETVARDFRGHGQFPGERIGPARAIRRDASGHEQSGAPARARGEIGGELRKVAGAVFQARVHGAHDDAIRESHESQVDRGEQMSESRCTVPMCHGRRF
jgi:hypothetical protein